MNFLQTYFLSQFEFYLDLVELHMGLVWNGELTNDSNWLFQLEWTEVPFSDGSDLWGVPSVIQYNLFSSSTTSLSAGKNSLICSQSPFSPIISELFVESLTILQLYNRQEFRTLDAINIPPERGWSLRDTPAPLLYTKFGINTTEEHKPLPSI